MGVKDLIPERGAVTRSSFRDAPVGAGPESILPVLAWDTERKYRVMIPGSRFARPGMTMITSPRPRTTAPRRSRLYPPRDKARAPSGVTRCTHLLDPDPDRVLVAVHPHLDHALGVAGGLALAPQRVARAAEIPGVAAFDGLRRIPRSCARLSTSPLAASVATQVTRPAASKFGLEFPALPRGHGYRKMGHSQPRKLNARVSAATLAPWTGNAPAPPDCRGTCR